jgi:hypothetical protein
MGGYEIGTNIPTRVDAELQKNAIPQQPTPNPTQPKTEKNKMEQKQKTKGNQSPGSKQTKGRELKAHQKERKPTKAWILNEYGGSFDHLQCELFFLRTCMWTQGSGKGRERPKKRQATDLLTHRKKKRSKSLQMMIMVMIMMQIFCARNQSET